MSAPRELNHYDEQTVSSNAVKKLAEIRLKIKQKKKRRFNITFTQQI